MSEAIDTHRMTPEQLKQAGELLFGNQWQSDLARALDVDARRVRDWLQERRPIPVGVKNEVIESTLVKPINWFIKDSMCNT